ncbi:MAG: hypothetical protein ACLUE8_02665 [Lachnospiraceae bacterium]
MRGQLSGAGGANLRDYLEDYTIAEIEQSVNAAYDDKHLTTLPSRRCIP